MLTFSYGAGADLAAAVRPGWRRPTYRLTIPPVHVVAQEGVSVVDGDPSRLAELVRIAPVVNAAKLSPPQALITVRAVATDGPPTNETTTVGPGIPAGTS